MPLPATPNRRSLMRILCAAPACGALPRGVAAFAAPQQLTAGPAGPGRLGYDGRVPGPVLRARRGEALRVSLANGLGEPTALHWHGLRHGAGGMAGRAAPPGGRIEADITPRDAGTFLYRPALFGDGPAQMRKGLCGLLLVEAGPADGGQPRRDLEVPLLLCDGEAGASGPAILANGEPRLALEAPAHARLWLRIANGTPHRIMQVTVAGQPLTLVALDGQPCEPFGLDGGRITLGPGQRAEIMWDVAGAPGSRVPIAFANFAGATLDGTLTVSEGAPLRPQPAGPPAPLPANPVAQAMDFRRAFRFELILAQAAGGITLLNGRAGRELPPEPAFRVRRGTVVMAGLRNETERFHAIHLEGHPARLLDGLDDGWKPFFLDTVLIAPKSTARIAFLAETAGRWLVTAQEINGAEGPLASWFAVD